MCDNPLIDQAYHHRERGAAIRQEQIVKRLEIEMGTERGARFDAKTIDLLAADHVGACLARPDRVALDFGAERHETAEAERR